MTKVEIIVKETESGVVEVLAVMQARGAGETDAERSIAADIHRVIDHWMKGDCSSPDYTLKESMSVNKPSPEFIADAKKRLER